MSELSTLMPPVAMAPGQDVLQFQLARRTQAAARLTAAREDPRAALKQAHGERNAADADIAQLTDTLARARAHLDAMAARRGDAEARAPHADAAAAEGLIAAFTAGASAAVAVEDDAAAKAARLGREAQIADAAVGRIGADLAAAEDRARIAGWRVRALALALLEAHGVEIAQAMLVEQEECDAGAPSSVSCNCC
jgi:hypothetical protein